MPAADQVVPGPAALGPAHPGADLRPPLDEDDDDDRDDAQVLRRTGHGRHPPQDHRHGLFFKHKLEQGEPLRVAPPDGLGKTRLCGGKNGVGNDECSL